MFRAGTWLAALLCAGCYLSHGLGEDGDGGRPRDSRGMGTADGATGRDRIPFPDGFVPEDDGGPPRDGGGIDAGGRDGGGMDAGRRDAGRIDAGRVDAGRIDSGRRDAGPVDSGPPRSVALHFVRGTRLIVPAAPGLDLTSNHTLELWIRPLGMDGPAVIKGDREARFHHGVQLADGEIVVGWRTGGMARAVRAPIADGVWTHVAAIYEVGADGAMTLTLVLNGETVAIGTFPNDLGVALNGMQLIFGNFVPVDLDEIRLWDFARRPEGIRATMSRRISPATPGLAAYWQVEEFGGQLVLDRTLNGHDAILGDMTLVDAADPEWITDGPF